MAPAPLTFETLSGAALTARQDLEDMVGQRATRRRKLFNAQIECTYFTFLGPKPPRPGEAPTTTTPTAMMRASRPLG